ncbi:MAG: hypothetical protein K0Q51_850 [Rickettsiaceae bacterium]|jgi:DUF1009 family protein|nr:hypothetical protein [Rickettsiaceae bacterium]
MTLKKVGLIAGQGELPYLVIDSCIKKSIPIFPIFLAGETEVNTSNLHNIDYKAFKIGQVGQILEYFKENNITDIVIVGGIKRPNLASIKVDFEGAKLLGKLLKNKILGDDKLLRVVAEFIESHGFKVISPQSLMDIGITLPEGVIVHSSHEINMTDAELGLEVAQTLGRLDIGQAVIVEEGLIIGVEAAEGTDNLIKRCYEFHKSSKKAILVKACKPGQDTRLDMPTVGPSTVENAHLYGLAGIAIEADKVFVVDYEKVVEKAKEFDVFLVSIK